MHLRSTRRPLTKGTTGVYVEIYQSSTYRGTADSQRTTEASDTWVDYCSLFIRLVVDITLAPVERYKHSKKNAVRPSGG